jgi:hypothetical protein
VEFDEARQLYVEGRLTEALALFERWPADPASCAYAAQCRRAQSQPRATWTGVWELTEK